jgi:hypothetical protein
MRREILDLTDKNVAYFLPMKGRVDAKEIAARSQLVAEV